MIVPWPFGDLTPLSYDLIMCDPPWRFETWSEKGREQKSPDVHYDTLTPRQIQSMFPVDQLAAKDCILWLWATHPMIDQQIAVARRWGFKFVTSGVWVKRTKNNKLAFGTGYRLRCASEPFLICTFGSPRTASNIRTAFEGPLRENSRKPDEAYDIAEKLVPGALRRADVFSRETRPGWEACGNEAGKFDRSALEPSE